MAKHIVSVRQVFYRHVIVETPEYDDTNPWLYSDEAQNVALEATNQPGFFNPAAKIAGGFAWEPGDDMDVEFDEQPLDDDAEELKWWAARGYPTARVRS